MYEIVHIGEIIEHNDRLRTFKFDRRVGRPIPGQFAMLWIPGVNAKPFSYSDVSEMIIEKKGPFTEAIFEKEEGDFLHIDGPKGNHFEDHHNKVAIVGGFGIPPVLFSIREGNVKKLLYGARTVDDFVDDPFFNDVEIVYATNDGTKGYKGNITDLIKAELKQYDITGAWGLPEEITGTTTLVDVCGPEMMMRAVYHILGEMTNLLEPPFKSMPEAYFSLERRMKCACGLCGACSCSGYLTCVDGPVFTYKQLQDMPDFGNFRRNKSGEKVKLDDSD